MLENVQAQFTVMSKESWKIFTFNKVRFREKLTQTENQLSIIGYQITD